MNTLSADISRSRELLRLREFARLSDLRPQIAVICARYGVARLSVFGSLTRGGEFKDGSDVDFLVEFAPGVTHGLSFFALELELEDLIGRRVDLNTFESLSRYFRDEVQQEAVSIYAAT